MRSFGIHRPRRRQGFEERVWPLLDVRARLVSLLLGQAPHAPVQLELVPVRVDSERRRRR